VAIFKAGPFRPVRPGEYNYQVTVLNPTTQKAAFWQAPVVLIHLGCAFRKWPIEAIQIQTRLVGWRKSSAYFAEWIE
jgi:hypothetical protein